MMASRLAATRHCVSPSLLGRWGPTLKSARFGVPRSIANQVASIVITAAKALVLRRAIAGAPHWRKRARGRLWQFLACPILVAIAACIDPEAFAKASRVRWLASH